MRADTRVRLRWTGEDLVFQSVDGTGGIIIDSDGRRGPSSTDALLLSLCACMAIDVRLILEKSRVPVQALEVEGVGERAETDPRRFTGVRLVYRVTGPREEHEKRLSRAVSLSREKYCSVLHSLRTDIDVEIEIVRA